MSHYSQAFHFDIALPRLDRCPFGGLAVGQAIPRSRYVRDYCARCGDPIRVTVAGPLLDTISSHNDSNGMADKRAINHCRECDPLTNKPTPPETVNIFECNGLGGKSAKRHICAHRSNDSSN